MFYMLLACSVSFFYFPPISWDILVKMDSPPLQYLGSNFISSFTLVAALKMLTFSFNITSDAVNGFHRTLYQGLILNMCHPLWWPQVALEPLKRGS